MIFPRAYVPSVAYFLLLGGVFSAGAPQCALGECSTTQAVEQFPANADRILDVVIGKDTVETVKRKLGESSVVRLSESDGSEMCYRIVGPKQTSYVIFEFGPLGGFNSVTGYRASTSIGKKAEGSCNTLQGAERVETGNKVRLGMTMAQFKKAIGEGGCEATDSIQYKYEGKRRMNSEELARFSLRNPAVLEDPYFDIRGGISGRFGPSGLRELSVYRTESY